MSGRTARAAALACLALMTLLLAGCTGGPEGTRANREWQQEAAARGPVGVAATFDVTGSAMHVIGPAETGTTAPFDLAVAPAFPAEKPYLWAPNATVDGQGRGLLVVEGAKLHATAGALQGLEVERVLVDAQGVALVGKAAAHQASDRPFPPAWEDANRSLFHADRFTARAEGVALTGFTRASLLTLSGEKPLNGTFTFSSDALVWDRDSRVIVPQARFHLDRFSLGGNVTGGTLSPEGRAEVEAPTGIFGRDATLELTAGRIRSESSLRLTQAVSRGTLVLPAQVEALPTETHATVAQGNATWVGVRYREKTGVGDAVLQEIRVTGTGADLVDVPLQRPPLLIQMLWDAVGMVPDEAGPSKVFFALGAALASPAVILIDVLKGFLCAFGTCPEQYPYPSWMDAGDVGVFYLKIQGNLAPGEYQATVRITGQNYPAVEVPLSITVEPRAAQA